MKKESYHLTRLASRVVAIMCLTVSAHAQSLGNAGTIEGVIVDQTGASVPQAQIHLSNAVSGYSQTVTAGQDGSFRLANIPPNPYHLEVVAQGFNPFAQDVSIRNAIPIQVKATLAVAGAQSTVTVESAADTLETNPSTSGLLRRIFVCDSNCGSDTWTLTIAVSPSRKSSPMGVTFLNNSCLLP